MSSYGAGQWMRDMALLRISPDTRIVADHLHPIGCPCDEPGERHLKGCTCPECGEMRAAVGRGMDKHIAATMAAKEAGRRAAEQEITAQQKREAAARAQVTRELAGYGAYPYRDSGGRRHRDQVHESYIQNRNLAVRSPDYAQSREKLREALESGSCTLTGPVRYAYRLGEYENEPGCGCGCEKARAGPADPVAQWWEVTRSLILPDYGQFVADVPDQPPGTCIYCRTGPVSKGRKCWYCNALSDLAIAKPVLPRRERADWLIAVLLILLVFVVAVLTMYVGLT